MNARKILETGLILILVWACNEDVAILPTPGQNSPVSSAKGCRIQEIEFRNAEDVITGIRDFKYNVHQEERLESITIVEGFDFVPITLRFEFKYGSDITRPIQMDEVFGSDVVTSTDFRYDTDGNLTGLMLNYLAEPYVGPPEFQDFTYEDSELANDSINARIIVFDLDRLTRDWIDVLPAKFTHGGKRIERLERRTFRDEVRYGCDFAYDAGGFLSQIVCRDRDGVLTEVWDFTYSNGRLSSAYRQLPNFRAITDYEYDDDGRPKSVVSSTDGFFNWKSAHFYQCR